MYHGDIPSPRLWLGKIMAEKSTKIQVKGALSEEEKALAQTATQLVEEWLKMDHPNCIPICGEANRFIDITAEAKAGRVFLEPDANRGHGKDQTETGHSLLNDYPQHPLLVLPTSISRAIGMGVHRFDSDPSKADTIPDDSWTVLDGNGRMAYLYGVEVEKWPPIFGLLPSKNKDGLIHPQRIFTVINTNLLAWKGSDYLTARLLIEGEKAHPAWTYINDLKQKGYLFTAACEWGTMKEENIKRSDITDLKFAATEGFKYHELAKKIHSAAVNKFGEGEDRLLKTKDFPKQIIEFFNRLSDLSGFDRNKAAKTIIKFIDGIESGKVVEITGAKKAGDDPKEVVRRKKMSKLFEQFIESEGIKID